MVTADIEDDPLFPRLCAAGASLRRIERSTEPDAEGRRSVWHQGKELTELTSWEATTGGLDRQELVFMGYALDYRKGFGLRTGSVREASGESGMPGIDLVEYDREPSQRVLELAARLLREARRDFYTQHLLQQLNDILTTRFNRPQTQVYELGRWNERLHRASQKLRHVKRRHVQVAIYVGIGMIAGAVIAGIIVAIL
jgi:hypothetical protein